jgi:DNA-binding transcriptional MerR regulator
MQKLQSIRDLQRLGFSLDEIKDLYDDVSHTPSIRQLTEKIKETEIQLKQLILFNSDRAACIRYIRENGENAFAEKMAKEKQMTMKK